MWETRSLKRCPKTRFDWYFIGKEVNKSQSVQSRWNKISRVQQKYGFERLRSQRMNSGFPYVKTRTSMQYARSSTSPWKCLQKLNHTFLLMLKNSLHLVMSLILSLRHDCKFPEKHWKRSFRRTALPRKKKPEPHGVNKTYKKVSSTNPHCLETQSHRKQIILIILSWATIRNQRYEDSDDG